MNPHQTFFLPHFFRKHTNFSYLIFSTSFFFENHQLFLPHFFGKPTNFSYLIFLGNHQIFLPHFFWETHQFFLPHFLGKPTNLVNETLKETLPHEVFGYYLCYHLEFLQAFHNEGRYH